MLQTYEGYYEDGRFYQTDQTLRIEGRWRAFITIMDEPARDDETVRRVAALDKFIADIEASDEAVPEFEKVKLREVEI
ncbi:MAG: hypothetical protein FWF83_06780 [Clostridiales bacterium]|nr:hypothetical protein [Clostridiales bacterium]